MGRKSIIITLLLLCWGGYTFYLLFTSFSIPESVSDGIILTNRVHENELFDVHLYISSLPNLPKKNTHLFPDPRLPDRLIPFFHSLPNTLSNDCCTIIKSKNLKESICFIVSLRGQYTKSQIKTLQPLSFIDHIRHYFKFEKSPPNLTNMTQCYTTDQLQPMKYPTIANHQEIPFNNHFIHINNISSHKIEFSIPHLLRKKEILYVHAIGTRVLQRDKEDIRQQHLSSIHIFPEVSQQLTYSLVPDALQNPRRYLLKDPTGTLQISELKRLSTHLIQHHDSMTDATLFQELKTLRLISVPKQITLGPVVESRLIHFQTFITKHLESLIYYDYQTQQPTHYQLPFSLNLLTSPRDDYCSLYEHALIEFCKNGIVSYNQFSKEPINDCPIGVVYKPSSLSSWLFQQQLMQSLEQLEYTFGMPTYDIDSFKLMMGGGNPILVCSTFLISFLHLIFSFLAISSDVSYWTRHSNEATIGLSASSIIIDIIVALPIFLYLHDEGKSKLILLLSVSQLPLHLWKLFKIMKRRRIQEHQHLKENTSSIQLEQQQLLFDTQHHFDNDQINKKEIQFSSILQKHLPDMISNSVEPYHPTLCELEKFEQTQMLKFIPFIFPIIILVAIYQLIYLPQKGWYSWIIHSLALCAYAGGFISMTPQLFRNYKLQSVDHLPWATLTYQALNAFVDDFFSFIIRMPNMHRVSVFRDDIIFIIYSVQRWKYRGKGLLKKQS